MSTYTFEAILKRPEGVGTWTYLDIPLNIRDIFDTKGQVKIKGMINDQPFRGSAMPHGDGTFYLVVNKAIRDRIGASQGDVVRVIMEVDSEPRQVTIPEDLAHFLDKNLDARKSFEALSYSHQKEYIDWVEGAKQPSTRQSRMIKMLQMLAQGDTPKRKKAN
jgi:hypothetical protein